MRRRLLGVLAVGVLWLAAHRVHGAALETRAKWPAAEEYVLLPPASAAPYLYAGYNHLGADLTWVRLLVYYGSARLGESDLRYLERFIDNVIALDPDFRRIYEWASYAVTFKGSKKVKNGEVFIQATQDEFKTSVHYLREGIKRFPESYDLQQALAMRLWWDLEPKSEEEKRANRAEAAALMERAVRLPDAPPDAGTLAATMLSSIGELQHAKQTLREMLLTTDDERARAKLLQGFRNMFAEREAEILARAKASFDAQRKRQLPNLPADLFVLLGPRPPAAIRLGDLANPRDLLGTVELDVGDEAPGEPEPGVEVP